ncbi:MAG TPA: hypothetical protein VMR70_18655, partial [Flavisolibacter sp.]|nr:hypothetical protein [Flavisolibacter sp.]
GQQELASCMTKAVGNYIKWLEKKQAGKGLAYTPVSKDAGKIDEAFLQSLDQHHYHAQPH